MLLAVDLNEHFIDVEGIAVPLVLSLQSTSVYGPELDTPEPDRFSTDDDSSFIQKIFNISVAEIEPEVEPDCVADDVRWKSVSLVSIHGLILAITTGLLASTSSTH